ncbi:MAG: hypothetical protein AAF206_30220, partial [Bacteroidota bacterium]
MIQSLSLRQLILACLIFGLGCATQSPEKSASLESTDSLDQTIPLDTMIPPKIDPVYLLGTFDPAKDSL